MGRMRYKVEVLDATDKIAREAGRRDEEAVNIFKWTVKHKGGGYITLSGAKEGKHRLCQYPRTEGYGSREIQEGDGE